MKWVLHIALMGLLGCSGGKEKPGDKSPSDTDIPQPDPEMITQSGVIRCADGAPRSRTHFRRLNVRGDWKSYDWENSAKLTVVGGGVGVADFDGDGQNDIVLPGDHATFVYRNRGGGRFTVMAELAGRASAAMPVDIDADGDKDLYVLRFTEENRFYENQAGTFVDITDSLGLAGDSAARSAGAAFADYDGDGDLDIFVSNYGDLGVPQPPGDSSVLYENTGGYFRDRSQKLRETDLQAHTFIAGWHDTHGSRLPELYLVNDFGWDEPNAFYRNNAGNFSKADVGLDAKVEAMGLAVGDVNGDEVQDFVVTAWGTFRFYESHEGSWFENHLARGVVEKLAEDRDVAWGAEFADLDHDLDLDLLVMNGFLNVNVANARDQPDSLFVQQPDGTFDQQAEAWGLTDKKRSRGFVFVDLDDDGWLDLVQRDAKGPQDIFMARCADATWMRVRLHGRAPNVDAIGAKVRVTAGDEVLVRWMTLGSTGLASGGPFEVHFGLGDFDRVDQVEVFWPSGEHSVYPGMQTRQIIDIHQMRRK